MIKMKIQFKKNPFKNMARKIPEGEQLGHFQAIFFF